MKVSPGSFNLRKKNYRTSLRQMVVYSHEFSDISDAHAQKLAWCGNLLRVDTFSNCLIVFLVQWCLWHYQLFVC